MKRPSFVNGGQCSKWPLSLLNQNVYITTLVPTAAKLARASQRKSSVRLPTINAALQCANWKKAINDVSAPAKNDRLFDGTRVWVPLSSRVRSNFFEALP